MPENNMAWEIKQIFDWLQERRNECVLQELFADLPEYYDWEDLADLPDLPSHQFLGALIIEDLKLPQQPETNSISFKGRLQELPEFLRQTLCWPAINLDLTVDFSIVKDEYGEITFTGSYQLPRLPLEIAGIEVQVCSLAFSSGVSSQTIQEPQFTYDGFWAGSSPLKIKQEAGSGLYEMWGDLAGMGESSAQQLFQLFGIEDVDIAASLPEEISPSLFDRLEVKNLVISADASGLQSFSAQVEAVAPLTLFSGKISLIPGLIITVAFIGDASGQDLNISAYGCLRIGQSSYDVYVNPLSGDLNLALSPGSQLDIAAMGQLFFAIDLPEVSFNKINAAMNFRRGSYSFELGVEEVMEFEAVGQKLALDNILLQVSYEAGAFAVALTGELEICGVKLALSGAYLGQGCYNLACCLTDGLDIKLGQLLHEMLGNECLLSDSFDFQITTLGFNYSHTGQEDSLAFSLCADFCGEDEAIGRLFGVLTSVEVRASRLTGSAASPWNYTLKLRAALELAESQSLICSFEYDSQAAEKQSLITLTYAPRSEQDGLTLAGLLPWLGLNTGEEWGFITGLGVGSATISYDFKQKQFKGCLQTNTGGQVALAVTLGEQTDYVLTFTPETAISLGDLPVAGGLVNSFPSARDKFSINELTLYAASQPDPQTQRQAGVGLDCILLGEKQQWQIYAPDKPDQPEKAGMLKADAGPAKIVWLKIEKSLAIFVLHRIGIGLDGSYITFLTDASLNVPPLCFDLLGAGIGFDLNSGRLKYYLNGFAISYTSSVLTIGGSLLLGGDSYAGLLLIKTKPFSLLAAAEYSPEGSLFAYGVASLALGGSPAFYVQGLALGFGYNRKLLLPSIDEVGDYPLLKAAAGQITPENMLAELQKSIVPESGQKFLVFGLKFVTYEIAKSTALLAVNFGQPLEVSLLGLTDITVPSTGKPLAHAQLALLAQLKPEEGFFGIEARLTPESYILAPDCHLTGGFAFYMWFAGEHSGDFVITLGGYNPKYAQTKPAHYPDVPRVGFNWRLGQGVNVTGEAYFALTPGALMAGGRLSLTCKMGALSAYFIAKADFLLNWKPLHYDIEVAVTIGASYRFNLLFVHKTISIELGADLHIWGPEFSGKARIKIWILSFDIEIGARAPQEVPALSWPEFCSSFLPSRSKKAAADAGNKGPLTLNFNEGLNGQVFLKGQTVNSVNPGCFQLNVASVIPFNAASFNNQSLECPAAAVQVKPMGSAGQNFAAALDVTIKNLNGGETELLAQVTCQNISAALWGGQGELNKNVPCGLTITTKPAELRLFPAQGFISLEDLYTKGAVKIKNAFDFQRPSALPEYTSQNSIQRLAQTIDDPEVREKRRRLLAEMGFELAQEIILSKYAREADNYLDEEVLIPV